METLSSDQFGARDQKGLLRFLAHVRDRAKASESSWIASISLRVRDLDPLAVLQSIHEPDEPHLYLERRSVSVSGAESVVDFSTKGPNRFVDARKFVEEWSSRIVATGDLDGWFSGPLFFHAFSFSDNNSPACTVFVPKWQVCRTNYECVAVANVIVSPKTDIAVEAERILRAHHAFSNNSYASLNTGKRISDAEIQSEDPLLFHQRVGSALAAIQRGEVEKVVLARWMDLTTKEDFRPLETLRMLREAYPDCFAFSYSRGNGASWIGATPERLVRLREGRFDTEAIAGSARRGARLSEDAELGGELLSSDKDLREHAFVVKEICRALEGLNLRPEVARNPHLLRLSNVQHLRTPISGTNADDLPLLRFIEGLHPTPAVNGVPSGCAKDLIQQLEPFSRGLYTGCLGWEKPSGSGESVVALRTARMEGSTARLFAGAGIVEGSEAEKELRETEIKLSAMASALGASGEAV